MGERLWSRLDGGVNADYIGSFDIAEGGQIVRAIRYSGESQLGGDAWRANGMADVAISVLDSSGTPIQTTSMGSVGDEVFPQVVAHRDRVTVALQTYGITVDYWLDNTMTGRGNGDVHVLDVALDTQ